MKLRCDLVELYDAPIAVFLIIIYLANRVSSICWWREARIAKPITQVISELIVCEGHL
ncbi:hypothetical protein NA56DRAFT_649244 [Hyaloscypha hepaticicola]|uniref:Uncharacterized protein n=1 Tax=Hyaloscypha hepaticicola TaxID=2082293 RepID=A0A2J6PRL8_9HELO|nr:hypothetical protein NA56DRAFT_649244 [Hyaloscypha hepaticicola]